ncbi:MAG: helix-turn-helix domain-containing protein [Prevotella sp.]|uniref:AAA family ATPase n=1 Tax=Prevotella vespertina TaxID=2608404 RepID=A0A7C9HCM0_9BACT|nr:helix-turn-helix domain-containing protein [Prevotella vespertina]MBF1643330.1 helix-turn-helix domain-containing protein [Prevotella sp.]MUL26769.1 AAA family ATPase [Prevotella vespertina]
MEKNSELRHAWDFVEHTGISIFLTGKAGTGKTTFLRTLKEKSSKRSIIVAPTGVAAINAGGMTIHSFFQLPLSPFVPEANFKNRFDYSKEKRKIIRTLDLLIIDEISMVRSDVLDAIDSVLRRFREHEKPFGGVQLLMIGDLQQLTPVVTPEDEVILQRYYDTSYFFGSKALRSISYVTIELTHVYRQQDEEFITLLNNIREGQVSETDLKRLNERFNPNFEPEVGSDYIRLTTHNKMAESYNEVQLHNLPSKACTFIAEADGNFPEYNYPADFKLTLKRGAQVMFIRNDNNGRYYNGRIGHVTHIDNEKILVLCPGDDKEIEVQQETWENTKYSLNEKTKQIEAEVQGTFKQYPLRLAWAITIHKSQGLTFEHAIIDAQSSFAAGQVYVALSRCKTLEGLILASPISSSAIINDNLVMNYISHQTEEAEKSIAALPTLKAEYYRQLLLELFSFTDLKACEDALYRVLTEYFYKYPKIITLHKMAIIDLDERIMSISSKWKSIICNMTTDQLHEDDFLQRMKKGALYFHSQLTEIFSHLLDMTKGVQSNNKIAYKRFDNNYADLLQTYVVKHELLERIMEKGFSINGYLTAKQEAILNSLEEKTGRNRKNKIEETTPKVPKISTGEVTFNLFKTGKSIEEIAKERSLTPATIQGHLIPYIQKGEIKLNEVIDEEKAKTILQKLQLAGKEASLKAIKLLCPADITYTDILLIMKTTMT